LPALGVDVGLDANAGCACGIAGYSNKNHPLTIKTASWRVLIANQQRESPPNCRMSAAVHSTNARPKETLPQASAAHYQAIIARLEAQLAATRQELIACRNVYRALLEAASFKDLLK